MPVATAEKPLKEIPGRKGAPSEPVTVEDGAIRFRPSLMELNRYYVVDFNGEPFLYRRVSDGEVEIYGPAPD